jgi:hypothetical protein
MQGLASRAIVGVDLVVSICYRVFIYKPLCHCGLRNLYRRQNHGRFRIAP